MPKRIGYEVVGNADTELLHELQQEESVRINLEAMIEQKWWSSKVIPDEIEALANSELIVVPEAEANYSLRWKLIQNQEPRTIRPQAYRLLLEIQSRWQKVMLGQCEDITDVYLAIVSLYRSSELQEKLRAETHMASKGVSSHSAGAAIDFDPNGYYITDGRNPMQANMIGYRNVYSIALAEVLEELVSEGVCHVIWEKGIKIENGMIVKYTACYHVCVSPEFGKELEIAE